MSYRMIEAARRLMCDKFSVLCTISELNEKQLREDEKLSTKSSEALKRFLSEIDLSSPKMDDDYALRLAEVRQLLFPPMSVKIKRLHPDAVIPQYAHDYDAGVDLVATEDVMIEPGETVKVPTGIAVSIPAGYEAQIRPRSGITLKTKLRVQLGTIDAGYIGELGVVIDNISEDPCGNVNWYLCHIDGTEIRTDNEYPKETYIIRKGERIAQLVFAPVEQAQLIEVNTLEETQRGKGGFGSSGVR
jgi:dUTP pyrophosphatase